MKKCRSCKYYIPDDAIRCMYCSEDQRKLAWAWKILAVLTNFTTFIIAIAIVSQSCNLNKQTSIIADSFELENRPYLYVDIAPVVFSNREKQPGNNQEYDNLYVGAKLTYKNVGRLPACNIKSEIHFYSDVDKGDNFDRFKKWYIDEFGYFPEPSSLFPHQEGQEIVCKVDCSESTRDYLFTVRITYTGEDPTKVYWYATDVRYSIEKGRFKQKQKLVQLEDKIIQVPSMKEYSVYFISAKSDYDRNGTAKLPPALIREDLFKKSNF